MELLLGLLLALGTAAWLLAERRGNRLVSLPPDPGVVLVETAALPVGDGLPAFVPGQRFLVPTLAAGAGLHR